LRGDSSVSAPPPRATVLIPKHLLDHAPAVEIDRKPGRGFLVAPVRFERR
jgi:hypothetical protein